MLRRTALVLITSVLATGCGKAPATGVARLTSSPVVAAIAAEAAAPAAEAGLPAIKVPTPSLGLPDGLTAEERGFLADGLLPPSYPALAAALADGGPDAAIALGRADRSGPYSDDFGDPRHMLAAARYARTHPYYAQFLKSVKRGDLVFIASNTPNGFVQTLSGGPFDHVMICEDPAPPGRYVEAVGITGVSGDPSSDRVRRTTAFRYSDPAVTLRIVRPAAGKPAMADRAIAYAEAQLGKPYNYTFSDDLAGESAFYCSSLVYKAYRKAGYVWDLDKDPARDRLAAALIKTVLALEPRDPVGVANELMRMLHTGEKVDNAVFARFVVRRLLPNCKKTQGLAETVAERAALEDAIVRVMEGHAFPRFADELAERKAARAAGAYQPPVLGGIRSVGDALDLADATIEDAVGLLGASRVDAAATFHALKLMGTAALPYAEILTAYFAGRDSDGAKQARRILDLLPGVRAKWATLPDLESPTDLAWTDLPHEDFNVKAETPVTSWPFALAKAPGR